MLSLSPALLYMWHFREDGEILNREYTYSLSLGFGFFYCEGNCTRFAVDLFRPLSVLILQTRSTPVGSCRCGLWSMAFAASHTVSKPRAVSVHDRMMITLLKPF